MDLGLPSGTLWLDRPLGAKSIGDPGLMYQWGSLVGYQTPSDFSFSQANYEAQGLNLITNSLSVEQDAAAAFYGNAARIPSHDELQELVNNTSISVSDNTIRLQSNINGNVIKIYARGIFENTSILLPTDLYVWTKDLYTQQRAYSLHISSNLQASIISSLRSDGLLIIPVKSS